MRDKKLRKIQRKINRQIKNVNKELKNIQENFYLKQTERYTLKNLTWCDEDAAAIYVAPTAYGFTIDLYESHPIGGFEMKSSPKGYVKVSKCEEEFIHRWELFTPAEVEGTFDNLDTSFIPKIKEALSLLYAPIYDDNGNYVDAKQRFPEFEVEKK
jgi:hypothetical protein